MKSRCLIRNIIFSFHSWKAFKSSTHRVIGLYWENKNAESLRESFKERKDEKQDETQKRKLDDVGERLMKKKKNKQRKRKSGWKNKYRLTRRMKAALGWFSRAALLFGPRGPVFSRGTELKCIMKAVPRLPVVSVHWAKCAKVSNFLFIKTSWPNEHNETGKGKCKQTLPAKHV